jgi:hypothetical protein
MHQLDFNQVIQYLLAGKAITTFQGANSRFTFKFKKAKRTAEQMARFQPIWYVSVLTGPNFYTYLGTLREVKTGLFYKHSTKSTIGATAPSVVSLNWVINRLSTNQPHTSLKIFHEGHCGRCGRSLTTRESINLGIGPECIKKMV